MALGIAGAVIALVLLVGVLVSRLTDSFTAQGSLTLGHGCYTGNSGYGDIGIGSQVTIRANGQTVAVGQLGSGELVSGDGDGICRFPIVVDNVPGGHDFYELEVSHRGAITYSEDDLRSGVHLTLG